MGNVQGNKGMATVAQTKLLTAEEFMAADLGEGSFELVRGEIVAVPPAMPEHGVVCANIAATLWNYGRQSGYGYPFLSECSRRTTPVPS